MMRAFSVIGVVVGILGPLSAPVALHALAIGVVEVDEADGAIDGGRSIDVATGDFSIAIVIDAEHGEAVGKSIAGYQFELTFNPGAGGGDVTRASLAPSPLSADIFGPPTFDVAGGSISGVNAASFAGGATGLFRIEQFDFTGVAPGTVMEIGVLVEGADTIGIDPAGNCGTGRVGADCDSFSSFGLTVNVAPEPGTALLLGMVLAGLSLRRLRATRR